MYEGVHGAAHRTHEERILGLLRERGALSRGDLARSVGVARSTLSDIAGRLLTSGAIVVADTDAASRAGSGRPAELLALDPGSGQFLGVDFAHREVHVAVADASHDVIASGRDTYRDDADWAERIDVAFELIDRVSLETGVHYGALHGIAIGIPGHATLHTLPGIGTPGNDRHHELAGRETVLASQKVADGVDVAFGRRFNTPVIIDNNTRFAALAEAIGGGQPVDDLIYVRLGDGVGGGLVVGGRLVTGSGSLAGEIGHINVDPTGAACRCGKNGCLETVASVPALLAACRRQGVAVHSLDDLAVAVLRSHPVVDRVLRHAGAALGRILGALAMGLDPREIVIGGEVTRIAPVIIEEVRSALTFERFPTAQTQPLVRSSRLLHQGGAIGGLAALFHRSSLLESYPTSVPPPETDAASASARGHDLGVVHASNH